MVVVLMVVAVRTMTPPVSLARLSISPAPLRIFFMNSSYHDKKITLSKQVLPWLVATLYY